MINDGVAMPNELCGDVLCFGAPLDTVYLALDRRGLSEVVEIVSECGGGVSIDQFMPNSGASITISLPI